MASITTDKLRELLLKAAAASPALNLTSDTIKIMLLDSSYVPDKGHAFVSAISGHEISGTGYASGFSGSGRKTLGSKAITVDGTNHVVFFDAADVTWTGLNAGTVGFAAAIKEVTSDADSPVFAVIDLIPDVPTAGNDYTIQWPANGLFNLG